MNAHENFIRIAYYLAEIYKNLNGFDHTVALDCYDTPKMLILVFINFRENQE